MKLTKILQIVVVTIVITLDLYSNIVEGRIQGIGRDEQEVGNKVVGKIVGGIEVPVPYSYYANSIGGWLCGGSLIHSDIVMSAAHCGVNAWAAGVRIGSNKRTSGGTIYNVTNMKVHERYNATTQANDIMLIKISDFANEPYVQVNPNYTTPQPSGADLMAMGFGYTSETSGMVDTLRQVNFVSVSPTVCRQTYSGLNDATMICNGFNGGGKDTCYGDSGGPVFLNGTLIQIGIVSYGFGCARNNVPAVNTRVSAYVGWIRQQICAMSNDKPEYCFPQSIIPEQPAIPTESTTPAPVVSLPPPPAPVVPLPPPPAPVVPVPPPAPTCSRRDERCYSNGQCCSGRCFTINNLWGFFPAYCQL